MKFLEAVFLLPLRILRLWRKAAAYRPPRQDSNGHKLCRSCESFADYDLDECIDCFAMRQF